MVLFAVVVPAESVAVVRECPTCHGSFEGESFCPNDGTRLSRTSEIPANLDPILGTVFADRYRIQRRIGEGGMGVVYEALHTGIEKRVAVKLLRDSYAGRADVLERFRQEARSASRIGNEHIVDITDFGESQRGVYIVMEFLVGEDLAEVLRRNRIVPTQRAISIAVQVCKGLSAAHAKGIIHRDMKPENIFLAERDGERDFVKILDFGIAKISDLGDPTDGKRLTKTGMIFGTPEYMSPEQAAGRQLDHRVDVYSTGVILYEMLCGRVPFTGESFMAVLTKHMFEPPPPMRQTNPRLEVGSAIEHLIMKALSKDPSKRFASMGEMLVELQHAGQGSAAAHTAGTRQLPSLDVPIEDLGGAEPARTLLDPEEFTDHIVRPRHRKRAPTWIALLSVLIAGGGFAAWLARGSSPLTPMPQPPVGLQHFTKTLAQPAVPDPHVGAPASQTDSSSTLPAPPPPPSRVTVRIETAPAGATVLKDDAVLCEATPCDIEGDTGTRMELTARKAGHRPHTAVVQFDRDRTESWALQPGATRRNPGRHVDHGGQQTGGNGATHDDRSFPSDLRYPDWTRNPPAR